MNSKRQTIWLVSMLSLMVVLSAYYLFSTDASKLDKTKDAAQTQEIKVDTTNTTQDSAAKTDTQTKATDGTAAKSTDQTAADATSTNTSTADKTNAADSSVQKSANDNSSSTQLTDAQVLQKVTQQGKTGEDYFMAQQMQRNDNLAKETQTLMTIITDAKQNTEAVTKAYDDLQKIQTRQAKLSTIEDELAKDYTNVIVTEEANKWKVVLQDNKLEKSQAVSIVDLVMKELSIGPENISVQVMPK
jgi:stage III sporulation protein AH